MSLSSPGRKVAGGRRNPATYGVEQDAPRWLRRAAGVSWRLIVLLAAVAVVFVATSKVTLLFVAVFLALVFTAVLKPIVDLLDRWLPRGLATAMGLLAGIAFLGGLLTYVVYSIVNQWSDLTRQFTTGIKQITDWLESGSSPFRITNEQIAQWISAGQSWISAHAGDLAGQASAAAGSAAEVFTCLALAVFCSIFFLARGHHMWTWFLNQLPSRSRDDVQRAAGVGWFTFSEYTRGVVIVALTDGLLAFALLLVLHVPLAAPLAVLVFIGAFIPLVGAPAAMVIAMIVALATLGPLTAGLVGLGIAGIGQIEGHILQPFVMGKQVSLHPVVIAISVTAGTLTAGILGAVVAVPLVAVGWAIFAEMRTVDPPMSPDDPPGEPDETGGEQDETAPEHGGTENSGTENGGTENERLTPGRSADDDRSQVDRDAARSV